MIATGNHNFEKFAALCNTLSGEPRRLRRSGRQVGDPYTRFTIHRTAQMRTLREAKSLPYMANAILQPSQILKRTGRGG